MTGEAVHRRTGEGTTIPNPLGGPLSFKLSGGESGGALTVFETVPGSGEGPPLHAHANEDEFIYFLEGTFRVRLGDDVHDAPPGSVTFLPRGLPHTWQNVGAEPGRLLVLFTPAAPGMENFFTRFAEFSSPDAKQGFATLGPDAGMTILGPPLADSHPT